MPFLFFTNIEGRIIKENFQLHHKMIFLRKNKSLFKCKDKERYSIVVFKVTTKKNSFAISYNKEI